MTWFTSEFAESRSNSDSVKSRGLDHIAVLPDSKKRIQTCNLNPEFSSLSLWRFLINHFQYCSGVLKSKIKRITFRLRLLWRIVTDSVLFQIISIQAEEDGFRTTWSPVKSELLVFHTDYCVSSEMRDLEVINIHGSAQRPITLRRSFEVSSSEVIPLWCTLQLSNITGSGFILICVYNSGEDGFLIWTPPSDLYMAVRIQDFP